MKQLKHIFTSMKKSAFTLLLAGIAACLMPTSTNACTGITLTAKDGARIVARTIEWSGSNLNSRYVIVPRGHRQSSFLPDGTRGGLAFTARYGYVGLAVEQEEFVAEGLNEEGLSAGLFYFPGYGEYEIYNEAEKASSLADLQLVPYLLANFRTVDEVKEALPSIHIIGIHPQASTAHWRIADATGRQVVLEIVGTRLHFYENKLGVLTNAPGFEWQLTNLNNYINLFPGTAASKELGALRLASFGAGSGFLGIPGDVTPPSRFVRAAFYQATAPQQSTATQTVLQSFQLLNSFDIPTGIEHPAGELPADIPSATQWTSATDLTNRVIYYRTMYHSGLRGIDLKKIDFAHVRYQSALLDKVWQQPVEFLSIR